MLKKKTNLIDDLVELSLGSFATFNRLRCWLGLVNLDTSMDHEANRTPEKRGFFLWGPQWGYGFPIRFVGPSNGHDEYYRRTMGIVTWAGSIFYAWPCDECRRLPCFLCYDDPRLEGAELEEENQKAWTHPETCCPWDTPVI